MRIFLFTCFRSYRCFAEKIGNRLYSTPPKNNSFINSFVTKLTEDSPTFTKLRSFVEKRSVPHNNHKSVLDLAAKIISVDGEIKDLEIFTADSKENSSNELNTIAIADLTDRKAQIHDLVMSLTDFIVPAIGAEMDAATLEISAGVGGQEAMIWANDLFSMYGKVMPSLGLKFCPVECDQTDIGGARKAFANISGPQAYSLLRFEAGIHRVQRVPRTERLGRIHTSTAAVIVMPQPSEIQVKLQSSDMDISFFRSSGPGGQHVNRTDSAVRIVHKPSNTIVTCQEERSQHKNKELALSKLRAILYEQQLESYLENERTNRRLQVGTKSRSEKIRTYNWPRRRVTDHRLTQSDADGISNLDDCMAGGITLVNIIEALQATDREDRLLSMIQAFMSNN